MSHSEQALYSSRTAYDTEHHLSRSGSDGSIAVSLAQDIASPMSDSSDVGSSVERIFGCPTDTLIDSRSTQSDEFLDLRSLSKSDELSSLKDVSEGSKPLSEKSQKVFLRCVINIALAALPLLFIVLTIVAAGLNGRDISSLGHKVQEAVKLGPTIYPIVFAAIVARCMRHIAQWQAEKGQYLGILEHLVQSQSFAGSIQTALKLRHFHSASLAITLIWALSPIGGQTSLRLLTIVEAERQTQIPNLIHHPSGDELGYFCDVEENILIPGVVNDLLTKSLNTANVTKLSTVDNWGNVKIPGLGFLINTTHDVDNRAPAPNPWVAVGPGDKNIDYSSLIGIPLWDVPKKGTAKFSLEWPIYNTDCQYEPPGYSESEWEAIINKHATDKDQVPCSSNLTSDSSILTSNFTTTAEYEQQLYSASWPSYIHVQYSARGSHVIDDIHYSGYKVGCKLRTYPVEAEIFCQSGACSVVRLRRSEKDQRPDFLTPWNDDSVPYSSTIKKTIFREFLQFLPGPKGATTFGYISGEPYMDFQDEMTWSQTVSDEEFSSRFSQIFNAILIVSQWPLDIQYRMPRPVPPTGLKSANATITEKYPVYRTNSTCIVLLVAVSTVLLLCALGSLVLELSISAPDIFGFVSSLTRDSEYFDHIPGGSVLSGTERTHRLKDVKVQIADVRMDREIGHIALTACRGRGREGVLPRLRAGEGRIYD